MRNASHEAPSCANSLKFTSHVSLFDKKRDLSFATNTNRGFHELVSCVDTWCIKRSSSNIFLIIRIRIQHLKFSCEYERTFGIISFTQLTLSMVHVHLCLQLVDLILISELPPSLANIWSVAVVNLFVSRLVLRTETTTLLISDGDSVGLVLDKHIPVLSPLCHTTWR